jgi:hypothetical protein
MRSATASSAPCRVIGAPNTSGALAPEHRDRQRLFEFTTREGNRSKAAGLSNSDTDQTLNDIDFAIELTATRPCSCARTVSAGRVRQLRRGDIFRVTVNNNVVSYQKNGVTFFTSTKVPTFPLVADSSLQDTRATITNAVLHRTSPATSAIRSALRGAAHAGHWDQVLRPPVSRQDRQPVIRTSDDR